jgi:hypothetical protein
MPENITSVETLEVEPALPNFGQLDVVGVISSITNLESQSEEGWVPLVNTLPGYHVNSPWRVPGWSAFEVNPSTPRRVNAGSATVFYSFADEAAFLAELATADLSAPAAVPKVVTMRQARLALLGAGLLGTINSAIAALPSPMKEAAQIEWEYSQEVQRHNGFVSQLAPILGLSEAQLDGLFVAAAQL